MAFNNAVDANQPGVQTISTGGVWTGSTFSQYSILTGGTSNAISSLGPLTNGQLLIGSTGAAANPSTLTAGAGITIDGTSSPGNITISASGSGLSWSEVSGAVGVASIEHGYSFTDAGTITLPTSPVVGATIEILCNTAGAVVITAGGTNIIRIGSASPSSAGGTATNTAIGNSLTLTYSPTNTVWICHGVQGNWTLA